MKLTGFVSLGAVTAGAWASSFEPTDFNVTEALIDNGIDVSSIPELAGLVERSSTGACSIAVRFNEMVDLNLVQMQR
jgi:hypothetical protein